MSSVPYNGSSLRNSPNTVDQNVSCGELKVLNVTFGRQK